MAPRTVCPHPGCPQLTPCPTHPTALTPYGREHRTRRSAAIANAIGLPCPLCGERMRAGDRLDFHHSTPTSVDATAVADTVAHASCNRALQDRGAPIPTRPHLRAG